MKIVSIHVPKAGGTTTLALWKQVFGEDRVQMDFDNPPVSPIADYLIDPVGWSENRPKSFPKDINVIHGHFKPQKYDLLKDVFRFTMLRHPVDNLISIYFYWKIIPPQNNAVHKYFLSNKLDIISLAQLPLLQDLYNQTYFGGWDMGRLDFIGRHETRHEDLLRLSKLLSINIDTKLHLNATEPEGISLERQELVNNPIIINQLNNLLANDIRFYEDVI